SLTVIDQREAEDFAGNEFTSDEDFVVAIDEMSRIGGQSIAVLHHRGCIARLKTGKIVHWFAAEFDPREAVSELGYVDCFVGGALHAHFDDRPVQERFTLALGAALANQRVLGAGMFERSDAVRLQKDIHIRELDPAAMQLEVEVEAD
ncbi:MAG: hypothetical protein H7287_01435, partial [Thermoleophilia bacterium]|nr:hypothetical protein [Thermoleophilia bacterium]